jgi:hypothetical protein
MWTDFENSEEAGTETDTVSHENLGSRQVLAFVRVCVCAWACVTLSTSCVVYCLQGMKSIV